MTGALPANVRAACGVHYLSPALLLDGTRGPWPHVARILTRYSVGSMYEYTKTQPRIPLPDPISRDISAPLPSAPPPSGSRLPSRGRPPSRIYTSNESFEDLRVRFRGARKQPPTLKCFNHVLHYYTSQHPQSQGRGIQIHGLAKPSRP